MIPVLTASLMRELDRRAIEDHGIPAEELMDRAGEAVANAILEDLEIGEHQTVIVLCGKGNNGGDGFVAARYLKEAGMQATCFLIGAEPANLTGEAATAYRKWEETDGETRVIQESEAWIATAPEVAEAAVLVDSLLGTGASGAPSDLFKEVIEDVNDADGVVLAVDMPTGVNANDGSTPGVSVHADLTVAMGYPKRGHLFHPGRMLSGPVIVADIGIPVDGIEDLSKPVVAMADTEAILSLFPNRTPDMHKGDRGRLLLVGGSPGMTGAMALSGEAAVKAGAGLVTVGVPKGLLDIMEAKLTEVMTLPLPELKPRVLSAEAFDTILLFQPGRLNALAIGPGAGRHTSTAALVRRLILEVDLPTVLDADGLYAFSDQADVMRTRVGTSPLVLTPHRGEFATLTGMKVKDIERDPIDAAASWAGRLDATIVLKGGPTIVAAPSGEVACINTTGSPALATGGTGDVLTGFVGGYLAQGLQGFDAAILSVYLHGFIADYVTEKWHSPYGFKASDILTHYGEAVGSLIEAS